MLINEIPASTTKTFTATLRPEQVFGIIELYRNKQEANGKRRIIVEASWKCPLLAGTPSYFLETSENITMKGENPYSAANEDNEKAQAWKRRCQNGRSSPDMRLESTPYDFALCPGSKKRRSRTSFRKGDVI